MHSIAGNHVFKSIPPGGHNLDLDFPCQTVYSDPIMVHCQGHVGSNFQRVAAW